MAYLLDTSVLLVLSRKEPEVDRLLVPFDDRQHDILLSTVLVAEFGRKHLESRPNGPIARRRRRDLRGPGALGATDPSVPVSEQLKYSVMIGEQSRMVAHADDVALR
jgi:predicted nucleic acid-binding protein